MSYCWANQFLLQVFHIFTTLKVNSFGQLYMEMFSCPEDLTFSSQSQVFLVFSHPQMFLGSVYCKQYGHRLDFCSGLTVFASTV